MTQKTKKKKKTTLTPKQKAAERKARLRRTRGGLISDVAEGKTGRIPKHLAQFAMGVGEMAHGQMVEGIEDVAGSIFLEKKRGKGSHFVRGMGAPAATGLRIRGSARADRVFTLPGQEVLTGAVDMQTNFTLTRFIMNPGNSDTFPWGSRISRCFELYKIERLEFTYMPSASTGTTGMVALFWEPDWSDPEPINMTELLRNRFAVGGSPWLSHTLKIPKAMFKPENTNAKRIRIDNVDVANQESHDFGKFYLAVEGSTDAGVGILSVDYVFKLRIPQFHNATRIWTHLTKSTTSADMDSSKFEGAVEENGSTLGAVGATWAGNTIYFPKTMTGHFTLICCIGSATSTATMGWSATGISHHNIFTDNAGAPTYYRLSDVGDNVKAAFFMVDFEVNYSATVAPRLSITGGLNVGNSYMDFLMFERPPVHLTLGSLMDKILAQRREINQLCREVRGIECEKTTDLKTSDPNEVDDCDSDGFDSCDCRSTR